MPEEAKRDAKAIGRDVVAGVTFSRYASPELAESISSLLSVTENVGRFLRVFVLSGLVLVLLLNLAFWQHHGAIRVIAALISIVGSIPLAAAFGIVWCGRCVRDEVLQLLDTSFDITHQAVDDIGHARERGVAITVVAALGGVNQGVILPTIEGVVRAKTGFLSRPVLWVYRGTFKRLSTAIERALWRAVSSDAEESNPEEQSESNVANVVEVLRNMATDIAATTGRVILVPLWVLLGLIGMLVGGPLAILWIVAW